MEPLLHKVSLNNEPLSTTATIFLSQGWLLYTGLTLIFLFVHTTKLGYKERKLKTTRLLWQIGLYQAWPNCQVFLRPLQQTLLVLCIRM